MNIETIKAALAAATPGPWEVEEDDVGDETSIWTCTAVRTGHERLLTFDDRHGDLTDKASWDRMEADAHLIANAPQWLADLVAEVERLRADRKVAFDFFLDLEDEGVAKMLTGPLRPLLDAHRAAEMEAKKPAAGAEG